MTDPMEGIETFIADYTKLPLDRVERIYRLGDPWPLAGELRLGQWAKEATGKRTVTMEDMARAALVFTSLCELEDPRTPLHVLRHIETVAQISGEDEDVVCQIYNTSWHFYQRSWTRMN